MSLGPNFIGKVPEQDGPFTLVAHVTAKSQNELPTVTKILSDIQKNANSDAEPDCTEYKVTQAHDDPLSFVVYEQYNSIKALEFHLATEFFQKLATQAKDLTSLVHLRFYKQIQ